MSEGGGAPSRRWWILGVIAAILSAGAYMAQVVTGTDISDDWTVVLMIVGPVATAAVILLAALQGATEARARREAEAVAIDAATLAEHAVSDFQEALNDIFLPFSSLLSKAVTTSGGQRAGVQAEAKRAVVSYVAKFVNADRARACFFELLSDDRGVRLECLGVSEGRADQPTTIFRRDNEFYARIFDRLADGKSEYWSDLTRDTPPGFPPGRSYQAFMMAPVMTRKKVYGLLTVDVLKDSDINDGHEPFIRLFAQLLAVALKGSGGGHPLSLRRAWP
jgi:hypothetical protein